MGARFRSCPRSRAPRGGRGWIPAPRFHEDKLRRKDGGTTSCPRKRVPRGGRWSVGASHAFQGWIPAFAGKTVEPRRARAKRVPRGGRWSVGASHAPRPWIPAFAGMVEGSRWSCPSRVGAVREPPLRKQGSTPHALRHAQGERNPTLSPALPSPERRFRAQL